jgi:hypothetical protein
MNDFTLYKTGLSSKEFLPDMIGVIDYLENITKENEIPPEKHICIIIAPERKTKVTLYHWEVYISSTLIDFLPDR